MSCKGIPFIKREPFIGCDGKPWSISFLEFHIELAIKEERYEFAGECKKEIESRKLKN